MPSFAAALALCHSIGTLMVSSLRLAPYFTWMVLVRSFPAFLMATCLTVSLSTPGPVLDVFGRRIVPSSKDNDRRKPCDQLHAISDIFCRHRNAKKLLCLRVKSNPSKAAAAVN